MPGIQGSEQIHDFTATAFADHHAVRSHAQRRADQFGKAYAAGTFRVGFACDQRHVVGMLDHAQFAHFLDGDDALVRRASHQHGFEHRGFAGTGTACHQHACLAGHQSGQQGQPFGWKHAVARQRFQIGRDRVGQSYADGRALRHQWCDDGVHAQTVHGGGVGDRAGVVKPSAKLRA